MPRPIAFPNHAKSSEQLGSLDEVRWLCITSHAQNSSFECQFLIPILDMDQGGNMYLLSKLAS
jgi:hypothetical protein